MRAAMLHAQPLRAPPSAAGARRGVVLSPAPLFVAAARRCVVAAPRPQGVLRLRVCASARVAVSACAAAVDASPAHPNNLQAAETQPPLLPRLATAARTALAAVAAHRQAAAQRAGPLLLAAGFVSFDTLALDVAILWNKALLLSLPGRILLFLAISAVVAVWLIVREAMIRFGIQCEFALDELRRTKPDLPPVLKGWRLDWKDFVENDWKVRRELSRFEAEQNAARSKELNEALARREMAEAQVAASVAQGNFVGAQQVADYLRVQRAARERRRRRFGLTPHERLIYELDRDLGLLPEQQQQQAGEAGEVEQAVAQSKAADLA